MTRMARREEDVAEAKAEEEVKETRGIRGKCAWPSFHAH